MPVLFWDFTEKKLESCSAYSEKSERNWGKGILTYVIFNLKVCPTNFTSLFFENFCRLLGFGGGGQVRQSPRGTATAPYCDRLVSFHLAKEDQDTVSESFSKKTYWLFQNDASRTICFSNCFHGP